jgi:5-bromo-4-chloroindolyl phosphate hydrolysis protein
LLTYANLVATVVWVLLVVPSLLWWKESVLWVILISLWANIVSHFTGYMAGRSELSQKTGHNLTKSDMDWLRKHMEEKWNTGA